MSAQPRLAARFEIGWQPHYPDTLLFLTLMTKTRMTTTTAKDILEKVSDDGDDTSVSPVF